LAPGDPAVRRYQLFLFRFYAEKGSTAQSEPRQRLFGRRAEGGSARSRNPQSAAWIPCICHIHSIHTSRGSDHGQLAIAGGGLPV